MPEDEVTDILVVPFRGDVDRIVVSGIDEDGCLRTRYAWTAPFWGKIINLGDLEIVLRRRRRRGEPGRAANDG